jgi:ketosteroid isomerase-like protein
LRQVHWLAARLKLPCAATAAKYLKWRSSMKLTIGITTSMSNTKNTVLARSASLWNSLAIVRRVDEKQKRGARWEQPENLKNMKPAKQLLETYLAAISAGEMERAIALFADDGGIEFPYFGSVNLPIRYQGPEALRRFFVPVMDGAENFKFKNIKIFPGEDENHVSGEYEVDAVIKKTGRRYRQLYGGRLIAESGKIKLLREFCDTVEVARAMFPNGVRDLVQKD